MVKVFGYLLSNKKAAIFIVDFFIISISAVLSSVLLLGKTYGLTYLYDNLFSFSIMGITFLLLYYTTDIYNYTKISKNFEQIITIIIASVLALPISSLFIYLFNLVMISRKVFLINGAIVLIGILLCRKALDYIIEQPIFKIKTAVIGLDGYLHKQLEYLIKNNKLGVEIIDIEIESDEGLAEQIEKANVEQIIIADSNILTDEQIYSLSALILKGIKIIDIPQFYQENLLRIPIDYISKDWLYYEMKKKRHPAPFIRNIKQLIDFSLGIICFLITLPLYVPIAICIKLDSKGPVFYKQKRLGKSGKPFNTYKFRSMINNAESDTGVVWAKEDDARMTRVGVFLRRTRLDELPQFINVLKGEMSIIGPRPEREEFINKFLDKAPVSWDSIRQGKEYSKIPFYALRLLVKPGITGWAQVNNGYVNSNQGTKEKLEYDLYYILNQSILFDLSILFKTISIVLLRKGV